MHTDDGPVDQRAPAADLVLVSRDGRFSRSRVGRVVTAVEWMAHLLRDFPSANVLFNVSRANRFSEANALRYYEVMLDDPFFHDFFREFLTTNVPAINANGGVDISPVSTPTPVVRVQPQEAGGTVPDAIATTPAA